MNVRRHAVAIAVAFASLLASIGAVASYHHDTATPPLRATAAAWYGTPGDGSKFWRHQTIGDCVEQSSRIAMDIVGYPEHSQATVLAEATKIGLFDPALNGSSGPGWPKLFKHFKAKAAFPGSMSKTRLEHELAAGHSVIAVINSETIWIPRGYVVQHPSTFADHALVIEAVSSDGGWVMLSDTGVPTGNNEVVPWATFSKAWSASGYGAVVVSR